MIYLNCAPLARTIFSSKMKFGKRLRRQIAETLPEWQDKFLSYKQLKKRIKLIAAECFSRGLFEDQTCGPGKSTQGKDSFVLTPQQAEFLRHLNIEMDKLNIFFAEKEEEYVIRLQDLKERIRQAKQTGDVDCMFANEEVLSIWKDIVAFHGEMVLLQNYSCLNYTGLAKILKKHDKHTGMLLRLPFIQTVLRQPFYTTELLSKLVYECEQNLKSILPATSINQKENTIKMDIQEMSFLQCQLTKDIYKSTLAALDNIQVLHQELALEKLNISK